MAWIPDNFDKIEFTIEEDGQITMHVVDGAVSAVNHVSADKLFKDIETLAGGKHHRTKTEKGQQQAHHHHNATVGHKH